MDFPPRPSPEVMSPPAHSQKNPESVSKQQKISTDSKDKLRAREQYHIDLHKPSLNAIGAVFNDAQHNKLYQKNFDKQYRLDNKELIKQRNAQYHADNYELLNKKHNCTCGGEYTHKHKTTHLKSRKHIDYLARLDAPAP